MCMSYHNLTDISSIRKDARNAQDFRATILQVNEVVRDPKVLELFWIGKNSCIELI